MCLSVNMILPADPQKFELANEGVTAALLLPELGEHNTTSGTPNKEKGLTIGPETPRMFFKAWRRQGPASIDASSSVSSMKSPPALIRNVNESPNMIPNGKRKFRYRTYGGLGGGVVNVYICLFYTFAPLERL